MKRLIFGLLLVTFLTPTAIADEAPLSADKLREEAELIVVGKIKSIRIESERSRIETGFGNYDWGIYLTIDVDEVEKGDYESDTVTARCFRTKMRKSVSEYLSPSGNQPIPEVGTLVRAYLYGPSHDRQVIYPNGLESPDKDTELSDAVEIQELNQESFTFLLPIEMIIPFFGLIIPPILFLIYLVRRYRRKMAAVTAAETASDSVEGA